VCGKIHVTGIARHDRDTVSASGMRQTPGRTQHKSRPAGHRPSGRTETLWGSHRGHGFLRLGARTGPVETHHRCCAAHHIRAMTNTHMIYSQDDETHSSPKRGQPSFNSLIQRRRTSCCTYSARTADPLVVKRLLLLRLSCTAT